MRILYLHRCDTDCRKRLERFIESLNNQAVRHIDSIELQVVVKAHDKKDLIVVEEQLSNCRYKVNELIELPDDGFDLGAYSRAVDLLPNKSTLFLNSHSWFRDRDAVDSMLEVSENILSDTIIGTSSSHSSLNWQVAYRSIASLIFFPVALSWRKNSDPSFPVTPNPHIRSNGFICMSESLRQYFSTRKFPMTKYDCHQIESGTDNLTNYFQNALVLYKSGLYNVPKEVFGGFRCNRQENLLINDNQVSKYDNASYLKKRLYHYRSFQ